MALEACIILTCQAGFIEVGHGTVEPTRTKIKVLTGIIVHQGRLPSLCGIFAMVETIVYIGDSDETQPYPRQ